MAGHLILCGPGTFPIQLSALGKRGVLQEQCVGLEARWIKLGLFMMQEWFNNIFQEPEGFMWRNCCFSNYILLDGLQDKPNLSGFHPWAPPPLPVSLGKYLFYLLESYGQGDDLPGCFIYLIPTSKYFSASLFVHISKEESRGETSNLYWMPSTSQKLADTLPHWIPTNTLWSRHHYSYFTCIGDRGHLFF